MLTRYEVARLVGIRALQISEGSEPRVLVADERLRRDAVYVAARELHEKKMDACVMRNGIPNHVSTLRNPMDLFTMLNTRDSGHRIYASSGTETARTSSLYDARDGTSSTENSCLSRREEARDTLSSASSTEKS